MSTLQAELERLYIPRDPAQTPNGGESCLITPDGRVRAMVLELARPADWTALSTIWQGVQADLGLPAPAIAVSGIDGYQLWFSLAESVAVTDACAFLNSLRLRYLSRVATERISMMPFLDGSTPEKAVHAPLIPALQQETGRWSAFVAADLGAIFADEPWLEVPPSPEAQAKVLCRLESIKPIDFQAVLEGIRPVVPANSSPFGSGNDGLFGNIVRSKGTGSTAQGKDLDPKRFLLDVMNDQTIELQLRIEVAKALLPYFEAPSS